MNENEIPRRTHTKKKKRKRRMSVGAMIVLDLLAIGVGLLLFALFHHVLDWYGIRLGEKTIEPVVLTTLAPEPEPSASPEDPLQNSDSVEPTPEPTPTRTYSGVWGEKFADKFTEGEIIETENSYQSENVNVTVTKVEEPGLVYYIADIYVSDLKYLRTASANGGGEGNFSGGLATAGAISGRVNALASICGDHYYGRREGLVVRNGVLYRDTNFEDVCVIFSDGRMETMTDEELDIEAIKAANPWQVWSFGPGLLDAEGRAKNFADRQSNALGIFPRNPRCAIGYYEPGHYCLVEIEGNRAGCFIGSWGLDLNEMGQLFEKLGCKSAYNFDGGRSAAICWMGEQISVNYGRTISDIVFVTDDPLESEG